MMRFVLFWTLAGFLIPVVIMIITQAGVIYLLPDWLVVAFWPSSIMLMGTMGQEFTPMGIVVLVLSVLINQILYSMVGVMVWPLFRRFVNT